MGTEIERLVRADGTHNISIIGLKEPEDTIDVAGFETADVVIDFTSPEIVMNDIRTIAKAGKNMVVGTTGWQDHLP